MKSTLVSDLRQRQLGMVQGHQIQLQQLQLEHQRQLLMLQRSQVEQLQLQQGLGGGSPLLPPGLSASEPEQQRQEQQQQ